LCFTGWRLSSASSEWLAPQLQPLYNAPQDSNSSFQHPQPPHAADGTVALAHAHHHHHHHQQQQVTPQLEDLEMNLEHVSLSLRLTCEMNRRLLQGIRSNDNLVRNHANTHYNNPLLQRGGGEYDDSHHPVHVHPSQSWQPPIKSHSEGDQEVLTMFHQKSPREEKASRRGVARWGPELLPYLHYLVEDVLKLPHTNRSLILVLTLVYLDRACSVETSRTGGSSPCPFLQPRTVHRLVFISLLTAARAVGEINTFGVEESLGISSSRLDQMETQFQHALGDLGLYVDPLQLKQWMMQWQDKFAKRVKA
jgi:hypothetical protein